MNQSLKKQFDLRILKKYQFLRSATAGKAEIKLFKEQKCISYNVVISRLKVVCLNLDITFARQILILVGCRYLLISNNLCIRFMCNKNRKI